MTDAGRSDFEPDDGDAAVDAEVSPHLAGVDVAVSGFPSARRPATDRGVRLGARAIHPLRPLPPEVPRPVEGRLHKNP
jgi:hypothetical protein